MGTVGMIGTVGIGVAVALAAPVLVWALVVTGLRLVARKHAHRERQKDLETRTVGA